jgi:hypothetical protein
MLVLATAIPAVLSVKNDVIDTQGSGHPFIGGIALRMLSKSDSFSNNLIDVKTPNQPTSYMGNWDWIEAQKITIPDGAEDFFGGDIALDGDTALIAAPAENNYNGSVYVYTRTGATWTQQQKLTPSDPGVNDCFGARIALQRDTAFIGASDELSQDDPGAVYVFTRTGTTWTEQQILTPPAGDPLDIFADPDIDGDTAIIGALCDDDKGVDAGAAYVFTYTGTTWTQQAKLYSADAAAGEWFGYAVDLDGDTAVISTYDWWNDTVNPGAAYVFTRTGTTWTQQAKLVGSDTVPGDTFGIDVALDGDTAIVGAANDCDQGDYSGSAFVFTRTGSTWTQEVKLLHSNATQYDWLGSSVSLEGDTALIGAPNEEEGNIDARGAAYEFTRTGTVWTEQQRLISSDGKRFDYFSGPLCFSGGTAFLGAVWASYGQGPNSGSVYVFVKTNLTFSITGGLGINLKITNNGMVPVNEVPWLLHVGGGILKLMNKTINGTTDITAGATISVRIMMVGLGPITISAKVADEEQTATGFQFIVISMVKK